ncbi:MAG: hypothetical protein K9M49_04230 [Candidatus Marinimicrobia bacterium]|nr:hypothetical protein [Candidatus Neomarinimicrobiota bacterium]MCF7851109.1 hypothetical protein [Candidatus Neomarinimicrobiota bacterium]MCF7904343.1 hypothetical protein [Candidatus Neomarinimicrobiota bacterium]
MHLRIDTLLDICGILPSEVELWIILYPPEIHTTTFYVQRGAPLTTIRERIKEQILPVNPYSIHYDWENFLIKRRENGHGKEMISVAFLGKKVLPTICSLLHKDLGKINFVGDGLQFLAVDETQVPDVRGRTYEVLLPYGETNYKAVFRGGVHFESVCHPKLNGTFLGRGKMYAEQVYLKYELKNGRRMTTMLLPLVDRADWKEALLTPSAFPLWHIAGATMRIAEPMNFAEIFHKLTEEERRQSKGIQCFRSKYEA